MATKAKQNLVVDGTQPVEILQIDTCRSRELFRTVSNAGKSTAAKILKDYFHAACSKAGGEIRSWNGDGGFAIFRRSTAPGGAIKAGSKLLELLPFMNAQTGIALSRESFSRNIRLTAHFGYVFLTDDPSIDAAAPEEFDDFLKNEKKFAPNENEFFITEPLFNGTAHRTRERFELFMKEVSGGAIKCNLYRLKRKPVKRGEDIFKKGDKVTSLSAHEWKYLRSQIYGHIVNVSARNQITKGLISTLERRPKPGKPAISADTLLTLTLDALRGYLNITFPQHRIRLSYWRKETKAGKPYLRMVQYRYPNGEATDPRKRRLQLNDGRYKICQCFLHITPMVTASVPAERLQNRWHDFDGAQATSKRSLFSALQFPVYWETKTLTQEPVGVLSLDANQPDVFLPDEITMWRIELLGYLANIALSERLRAWT